MTTLPFQAAEAAGADRELVVEPSRPHFQTLDGLRGVAAFCVFLVHSFSRNIAANGFLGVDFFFMLSGFVIASAYSDKLVTGSLTFREFCLRRFERLWPMLVVGTLLGLVAALIHNVSHPTEPYALRGLALLTVLSSLLIPQVRPFSIDTTAFPLNTVVWSLFFEVCANLFYAGFARFFGLRAAISLAAVGLSIMLAFGTEGGGSISTLYLGVPRVLFGFFAGVSLWELHRRGALSFIPRFGIGALSIPLLAITFIPVEIHGPWFLAAALVFAAVIASGAQDRPSGLTLKTCIVLGALSYPLYLIHRPLLFIIPGIAKRFVPMEGRAYMIAVAVSFAASLTLSYLLEKHYEVPTRRWLRSVLLTPFLKRRTTLAHVSG